MASRAATLSSAGPRAAPAASAALCWRALRARQWAHFALLPLAGLPPPSEIALPGLDARIARGIAVASLALAFAYGLNAITDRDMDASADKNPLAGQRGPLTRVVAAVVACGVLALALAASGGTVPLGAAALSIAASTLYSAGPRLKAKLLVGTACNVAIFAPLLLVALPPAGPPPAFAHLALVFTGLLLQNQLLHERADEEEDARGRVRTTARALGERGVVWAIALLGAAAAGAGALIAPSAPIALASAAALAAGAAAALPASAPAAHRRALHRLVALAGGAVVFLIGWLGPG
jgi:4-hydroxybenzoate polyprenyltransferase